MRGSVYEVQSGFAHGMTWLRRRGQHTTKHILALHNTSSKHLRAYHFHFGCLRMGHQQWNLLHNNGSGMPINGRVVFPQEWHAEHTIQPKFQNMERN